MKRGSKNFSDHDAKSGPQIIAHEKTEDDVRMRDGVRAGRLSSGKSGEVDQGGQPAAVLEDTIRFDVIPHLYKSFGPGVITRQKRRKSLLSPHLKAVLERPFPAVNPISSWLASDQEKEAFLDFLIRQDEASAFDYFRRLMERGASYEDICQGFVADIASIMNDQWSEDQASFVDITLASSTLTQLIREFGRAEPIKGDQSMSGKTALITSALGENHLLGSLVVENFLKRDGWTVFGGQVEHLRQLSAFVRKEWFTLIGISVSGHTWLETCAQMISLVRAQSLNPDVVVVVGGHIFRENPENVTLVGADVVAHDAQQALLIARRLESNVLSKQNNNNRLNKVYQGWMDVYQSPNDHVSEGQKKPLQR